MSGGLAALLGVEHPVVQGPFGGGISRVRLAAAVSDAGGLGSFGAHHLEPDDITALVAELKAATDRPFNVNLWVPHPDEHLAPSPGEWAGHVRRLRPYLDELGLPAPEATGPFTPDFAAQLDALIDARPPVISFVMGVPPAAALERAKAEGIVTIGTATTVDEAIAVRESGMDVVVASGSDAGGHRGAFLRPVAESLVGTFSLVPQVRDAVDIPVIAAGGIADARGVAAAVALGADGVQVGTGFLATAESGASDGHKAALRGRDARTTALTRLYSGRPARAIVNRFMRELRDQEDAVPSYPVQNALMRPIRQAAGPDITNLWAGQAASLSRATSARDYLLSLVRPLVSGPPATMRA